MAFVIKFPDAEDYFANVHFDVNERSGRWDDVMLVKALLNLVYSPNNGMFKSPLRAPLTVNRHFDNATATLIRHFQRTFQKRVHPDGIVSRFFATSYSKAEKCTIINLQRWADRALAGLRHGESVLEYLKSKYPELAGPLSVKAAPGTH